METLPRMASSALQLSGNSYVDCGTAPTLSLASNQSYSIEAWVYPKTFTSAQWDIVTKYNATLQQYEYGLWITPNGNVVAFCSGSGGTQLSSTSPVTANSWNHVATTYDGAQQLLTLYLNGVQQGQVSCGPPTSAPAIPTFIGAEMGGNYQPTNCFQGMVGTVSLYDAVRDLDQIVEDSVQWEFQDDPSLIAYYDFTNLPAVEESGNLLSFTLENGAAYCVCIPGLNLQGTGYADCGSSADLSFGANGPYTIEGWFCPTVAPVGTSAGLVGKWDVATSPLGEYAVLLQNLVLYGDRGAPPGGGGQAITFLSTPPLTLDTYYHFATSFDGSTLRLYVNGNLQSACDSGTATPNPNLHVLIGALSGEGSPTDFFQGYIQNVRLWNVALDQEAIRQWIYNEPIEQPGLVASFDFSVSPPVDNAGTHTIQLSNTAVDYQMVTVAPTSTPALFGFLQPNLDTVVSTAAPEGIFTAPLPHVTVAPQVTPFSPEHLASLRADLAQRFSGTANATQQAELLKGLDRAFQKASQMVRNDPRLLHPLSTRVEDGMLILTHHTPKGDVDVFQAPADAISPCQLWWISFIYSVTIGFFGALGLLPTPGNIAGKVWDLISRNVAAMNAINQLITGTVTLAASLGVVSVIWKQGLVWPLLKLAFTSAGWWALFWILKKVIAFLTGLEAAELLAGFISWAAQLVYLVTQYPTSCGTTSVEA